MAAWPVIRAIWWWTPETALFGGLIIGWIELAEHTTLIYRLAAVAAIVGVPAAVKPVRTRLNAAGLVPDHPAPHPDLLLGIHHHQPHRQPAADLVGHARPRSGNASGSGCAPACPWMTCQDRLDKIAVACWATAAIAEAASRSNAAFVRMDIKRRDALTGTITSPLLDAHQVRQPRRPAGHRPAPIPTALDLPQVTASEVTPVQPTPHDRRPAPQDARPGIPQRRHRPDDDITDWL